MWFKNEQTKGVLKEKQENLQTSQTLKQQYKTIEIKNE